MKRFEELTIVTPNKPGKLAQVLRALAAAKLNLTAIDSSSGYDLNMVRLVASDPRKAKAALEKLGYSVTEATVLGITIPDKPGQLARISSALAKARLNIDYMYASAAVPLGQALVIVHVADPVAAERALHAAGIA